MVKTQSVLAALIIFEHRGSAVNGVLLVSTDGTETTMACEGTEI